MLGYIMHVPLCDMWCVQNLNMFLHVGVALVEPWEKRVKFDSGGQIDGPWPADCHFLL